MVLYLQFGYHFFKLKIIARIITVCEIAHGEVSSKTVHSGWESVSRPPRANIFWLGAVIALMKITVRLVPGGGGGVVVPLMFKLNNWPILNRGNFLLINLI